MWWANREPATSVVVGLETEFLEGVIKESKSFIHLSMDPFELRISNKPIKDILIDMI